MFDSKEIDNGKDFPYFPTWKILKGRMNGF